MKSRTLTLILCLSMLMVAHSQQIKRNFYYVDSFARSIRYRGDLGSLTNLLTAPYPEQLYKARSIFRWITENIRYDYKSVNRWEFRGRERKSYRCKDDEDCSVKKIAWETRYISRVLRRKKAVCAGYAMLFKKMCDLAGLRSVMIEGYTRTEYYQVGSYGSLDHAWNAVWIDSSFYLLDATWASGGCGSDEDGRLLYFVKKFNDYYWMTPPGDFARNHFPRDSTWVLAPHYSKRKFAENPYYDPAEIQNVRLITPGSGVLSVKLGDTIRWQVEFKHGITQLQINSNVFRNPDIYVMERVKRKYVRRLDTLAVKMQKYVSYRRDGHMYMFEYVVKDASIYYLDLLFDRVRMMRFNVHVDADDVLGAKE